MPARPWQILDQAEPQRDYLVQLSYLPLVRYRSLPRFGRWLLAIQKQLSQTKGVVGYSLLARPLKREFWTLSAWSDRSALHDFVRAAAHVRAMSALRGHMGQTVFIEWALAGKDLPPRWNDALKRFHERGARY
jgi:hypothetical protein